MKSLLRSPVIQTVLSWIIWAYMVLIGRTIRWTVEGLDDFYALWDRPEGFIVASWHSRIFLIPSMWSKFLRKRRGHKKPPAILISLSRDGAFVAQAAERLGVQVIRGSASNKKKQDKNKGGAAAIREISQLLDEGNAVCLTVDGPRGPRQRAGLGSVLLAQRKNAQIIPYAVATAPSKRLRSWDRFVIPFPFTRGAIVMGTPIDVSRGENSEAIRFQLEAALNAATKRAEDIVRGTFEPPEPRAQTPSDPASNHELAAK